MADDRMSGNEARQRISWGVGIALGMGVGVAMGSALDNMGVGICIGIAIGVAFAVAFGMPRKRPATDVEETEDGEVSPGGDDSDSAR
jgi:hypothetical protein